MKKILLITLLVIIVSISLKAQRKPKKPVVIPLKITYIHREQNNNEALAKNGRALYRYNCPLPDSIKVGMIVTGEFTRRPDTCKCVFLRIK